MTAKWFSLARTHHAFTIRSDEGIEVLVHLGLDTVMLEGRGIEACVTQGQRVQAGEPLCYFDLDQLALRRCLVGDAHGRAG